MSDIIPLGGDDKSPISPSVIRRDIYRLKSFLIAEQRSEYDSPATAELSAEYFEQETSRLLVLASLEIRLLIDNDKSLPTNRLKSRHCGNITKYVRMDDIRHEKLTFLKAYNSIIHAQEIIFRNPDSPYDRYDGSIITRNMGRENKTSYEYHTRIVGLDFIGCMLDCVNLAIDN